MAVSSTFNPGNGVLTTTGDNLDNTITTSRDATGSILINAGAVPIQGGTATVTNTGLIQAFGQDGNDTISLDETNGALPSAKMFGGLGNDTVIGGSGADQLLGEAGNDVLNGAGGADAMTGGAGNDAYFVDNISDQTIENPGEGNDTVFSTVDFRLSANIDNLILQGGADLQAYGNSAVNALFGNAGSNILDGGAGADAMTGGAGNDAYFVDNISDQTIENPGEGNDTVFSTVDFRLSANVDNLILQGGADLQAYGNSAVNALFGNAGSNILDGGAGADAMTGGAGNDAYFVDNAGDVVVENGGEGNDTVFSSAHFALSANVENLVLQGGADLQGYGNDLANALFGNTGNNLLDGGAGADSMSGGAGNDVYFVDNAGDAVNESAGQGNDTVFSSAHFALSANVENLVLQGGADLQGYGNGLANAIFGNSGNNLIDGGGGANSMSGGAGNDIYFVDNAGDVVAESAGQGNDAVFASINYGLTANVETLVLQGGADLQGFGNGLANSIFGNTGNNLIDGEDGNDIVIGGRGDDVALLGAGDDTFVWNPGDGNDTVEGQAGADTLIFNGANVNENINISANGGRATFTRDVANVTMDLDGTETIDFHALGGADTITVNDMSGTDVSKVRIDLAAAGGGGDGQVDTIVINATNGNDAVTISSNNGVVTVSGLAAEVTISGFEATDRIVINSLSGDDVVDGSGLGTAMEFSADGGDGADVLIGSDGADTLKGGAGDDVLIGGPGLDILDGGPGDNVVIQSVAVGTPGNDIGPGTNHDVIQDFAGDVIALAAVDANLDAGGDQAFSFIGTDAFSAAGQLRFFADGAGNTIVEGNVDNNLGADFQIALHNFTGQLHASDFLL